MVSIYIYEHFKISSLWEKYSFLTLSVIACLFPLSLYQCVFGGKENLLN